MQQGAPSSPPHAPALNRGRLTAQIISRREAGETYAIIRAALGIGPRRIRELLTDAGRGDLRIRSRKWNDLLPEIVAAHDAGECWASIAERYNTTKGNLQMLAHHHRRRVKGLPRQADRQKSGEAISSPGVAA